MAWVWDGQARGGDRPLERREEIDPFAGGYPVPPLPGQRLREPSQASPRPPHDPGQPPTRLTGQEAARG